MIHHCPWVIPWILLFLWYPVAWIISNCGAYFYWLYTLRCQHRIVRDVHWMIGVRGIVLWLLVEARGGLGRRWSDLRIMRWLKRCSLERIEGWLHIIKISCGMMNWVLRIMDWSIRIRHNPACMRIIELLGLGRPNGNQMLRWRSIIHLMIVSGTCASIAIISNTFL